MTTTRSDLPGTTHDRVAVPLAIVLWIAVVAALAYGVLSTARQVVALFS